MLRAAYGEDGLEAGLDEAGRGCLAGPVVAAFVILPKDYHHPFLTDSKQLTPMQRHQLRFEIEREAIDCAVAEVCNRKIDEVNILNASFKAMHLALEAGKLRPALLLVDGNRFIPYLDIPHQCIVKGDSLYFSIAAASVLAKTYRDDLMLQLAEEYPVYQWHTNKGYPTPSHRQAIATHGITPYHRLSFTLFAPSTKEEAIFD